jgi:RimJ/RimL family protein N-acetyltransferase
MEFPQVKPSEGDALLQFLTAEEWPFHVVTRPDPGDLQRQLDTGAYDSAFWITDGAEKIGLIRLMDLEDDTPLFDLRISASARGRGVGTAAVRWVTTYVFTNYATNRIEGTTRVDNHAMRRVFTKAGYVKEAHYREAWPTGNHPYDALGYAILRHDWENGTTTPVNWSDE